MNETCGVCEFSLLCVSGDIYRWFRCCECGGVQLVLRASGGGVGLDVSRTAHMKPSVEMSGCPKEEKRNGICYNCYEEGREERRDAHIAASIASVGVRAV